MYGERESEDTREGRRETEEKAREIEGEQEREICEKERGLYIESVHEREG